jgi:hypothetical protein
MSLGIDGISTFQRVRFGMITLNESLPCVLHMLEFVNNLMVYISQGCFCVLLYCSC